MKKLLTIDKEYKESNFKELLKQYLDGLNLVLITTSPEYHLPNIYDDEYIMFATKYYKLLIAENSLNSLYRYTIDIYEELLKYKTEHNFDWIDYASTNRINSINEYGGEDEDYDENGEIIFSTDYKYLKNYTLIRELKFSLGEEFRGPSFGTSTSEDYLSTSIVVEKQTDMCPFKFFRSQGSNINLHVLKDGEMVHLSEADRIEREMNEDIRNKTVVQFFNKAIDKTVDIKEQILNLNDKKNNKKQINNIINQLEDLLNLNYNFDDVDDLRF
ncbi:MAG: hypothetical protein ACOCVF_03765 [bacterium]